MDVGYEDVYVVSVGKICLSVSACIKRRDHSGREKHTPTVVHQNRMGLFLIGSEWGGRWCFVRANTHILEGEREGKEGDGPSKVVTLDK
jgi:hypothetical protein